jgi:hypothetical protein
MKSLRYLSASLAFWGLIGGSSAFANSVTVVNATSYTLVDLYGSSSDAAGWDQTLNMIPGHTVAPGGQITVPIGFGGGDEGDCHYDFMAVLDGASQAAYQYEVNGCNGDTWTITP